MVAAEKKGGAGDCQGYPPMEGLLLNCAPPQVRADTKYNVRTGKKLSPLVVCRSGQFGIKEMSKDENGPWRSPRTDPPTEVKY